MANLRRQAMCFVVKEDGSIARPNDGICDSESIIAVWRSNGWIDDGRHLDVHPASASD